MVAGSLELAYSLVMSEEDIEASEEAYFTIWEAYDAVFESLAGEEEEAKG